MKVSDDGRAATLDIQGQYDAAGIEKLIADLSAVRMQMSPPVPKVPPATTCPDDAAAARAGGDPCVQVAVLRGGLTRFWVRHAGLGWFGFNLPAERAHVLASYILDVSVWHEAANEAFRRNRRKSDLSH